MKQSGKCIKCNCRQLLVIEQVNERQESGTFDALPVCVTIKKSPYLRVGRFEIMVCTQCGYTEWYAQDFGELRQHLPKLYPEVRLIDTEPPAAPYR